MTEDKGVDISMEATSQTKASMPDVEEVKDVSSEKNTSSEIKKEENAQPSGGNSYASPCCEENASELPDELLEQATDELELSLPARESESENNGIKQANKRAIALRKQMFRAIVFSYLDNEEERIKHQKPLLDAVVNLTKLQLWSFNIIIGVVVLGVLLGTATENLTLLIDILKYYIGATIVELIGMLYFVARATFSSDYVKIMEHLIEQLDNDKEDIDDEQG